MREFILLTAQSAAEAQGVNTEAVFREESVEEEIFGLRREIGADYLVLSGPQAQEAENVFTYGLLQRFGWYFEQERGAQITFTNGDEP